MLLFPTFNVLKGLFVIWNVIFKAANANSFQGKLPDPSLISTFFNILIKPYLHSKPIPRALEEVETAIEKVVILKMKQLKPFLQDEDQDETVTGNDLTLQGNDETTIVEFIPQIDAKPKTGFRNRNDTLKANMRRYKRVSSKIYEALGAEMVSEKTKTLVMRTLNELLSKMVETQCHWKGSTEGTANKIHSRFIIPRTFINMWKKEWQKFKTKFSTLGYLRERKQLNNFDNLILHLTRLNTIINDISGNLETFAKKYKIRCNVLEREDLKKNKSTSQKFDSLRLSYDSDNEKGICKNFKVCSKELKTFFIDFYNSINDTVVNVLKNYAEMYTRDVNTDVSNEKNSIVELIFKIADQTEKDIIKIFVNYTTNFHLDQYKEKEANINFLLEYIKTVIQRVEREINKNMFIKLKHLHKKVSCGIQQDVAVNLGVDLGNLERDLTSEICLHFNICNSYSKNRRHGVNPEGKENSMDNQNKIYVKVELTIDEDRNELMKINSNIQTTTPVSEILELNTKGLSDDYGKHSNFKKAVTFNYKKYSNISVTRTTLKFINKTIQ